MNQSSTDNFDYLLDAAERILSDATPVAPLTCVWTRDLETDRLECHWVKSQE